MITVMLRKHFGKNKNVFGPEIDIKFVKKERIKANGKAILAHLLIKFKFFKQLIPY